MPADSGARDIHETKDFLSSRLAELLDVPRHELDHRAPLHSSGLDSAKAVQLVTALSEFLGRPVPVTALWDHPTPEALCRALAGDPQDEDTGTGRTRRD